MSEEIEAGSSWRRERRPPTVPDYPIPLRGFVDEETAHRFANVLRSYVTEISRIFDLSRLDGITVAFDYSDALAELDRGFETSRRLSPSADFAVGVAMTPNVMRDGIVKSHIILNADMICPLEDQKSDGWARAFHTLVHECAHVDDHKHFDTALPGILLQKQATDIEQDFIWQISDGCWGEYAATRLSAGFGEDPLRGYEDTFLAALGEAPDRANAFIADYRLHGDHTRILVEVTREYAALLKYASYLIGHLSSTEGGFDAAPRARDALKGHWFEPFFWRMVDVFEELWANYGEWKDFSEFEAIGAIGKDLIAERGVSVERLPDGSLWVDVP